MLVLTLANALIFVVPILVSTLVFVKYKFATPSAKSSVVAPTSVPDTPVKSVETTQLLPFHFKTLPATAPFESTSASLSIVIDSSSNSIVTSVLER